jgi:hypothetical protein
MNFDKNRFRKEVIGRLKKTKGHFADISDIVNDFIGIDMEIKKEVERELVHLVRNMKVLDLEERDPDSGKMNDDWLEIFKKSNVNAGDKIKGLYASLTKDYFADVRQKRIYYLGLAILVIILLIWAKEKLLAPAS